MRRDKLISVRVNSEYLELFKQNVDKCKINSWSWKIGNRIFYKEPSIADLLEDALIKFNDKNKNV